MLKNYIKIALRNLKRDKLYVSINIIGLAVGIGVCFVIAFYIQGELSYDSFHENKDRIYRLTEERTRNGEFQEKSFTAYSLSQQMEADLPEVETVVTMFGRASETTFSDGENFYPDILSDYTESEFFDVFSIKLISGNKETILNDPKSIAVSKSIAQRIFGSTEILGKNLYINANDDEKQVFTVNGVFDDIPENSHFDIDVLFSLESRLSTGLALDNSQFFNYVLVRPETDINDLSEKTRQVVLTHFGEERVNYLDYKVHYQPLTEVYLSSFYAQKKGNANYIKIFSIIAVFILIIGIINYTNLSTARSAKRSLEVGIRKASGASRFDLIKQFLGESLVYSLVAIPIALAFVDLLLPYFNSLLNSSLSWNLSTNIPLLLTVSGLVIVAGLLSSTYPALILSAFKPTKVFNNAQFGTNKKHSFFRKGLITFQFIISSLLIICTLIITDQLNFIQNKNLGFDEELIVRLDIGYPNNRPSSQVLKSEFQSISSVKNTALSYGTPGSQFAGLSTPVHRNDSTEIQSQMDYALIDENFLELFNMSVIAGENFKNSIDEISTGVVINESAVQSLGWSNPNQAIGKSINTHYDKDKKIIAVVKDFHYKSIHNSIQPLVMVTTKNYYPFYNTLAVKLNSGNLQESVEQLEATWTGLGTGTPLQYQFMDDTIAQLYEEEKRISMLFYFFAFIAITISSIGLLGLTAFSAERRTKEIGIRKVLGATVSNIVALLSKDFILLVLTGFAIAIPIAWYAMNQWLANFAYRIEIGPDIFALAGGAALIIALLTVSWQSIKAAVANPVDSLRSE